MAIGNDGRDIVCYLLLVIPLEFIMTSRRVVTDGNRRTAVIIAGTLLALFSSVKIGLELTHKEQSYFDMMDVTPSASAIDIKKGYKKASLRVHPDKLRAEGIVDEESADEAFVALKAAYDVLMDPHLRDLYSKFGPPGLAAKNDTQELLASLGFFYVVWLAVAYLLTRKKQVGAAQTWTFTGLLALGIFEYQTSILAFDFLQDALPTLAMFEKVELLHRLYPVYLLGARLVAALIYEDIDTYNAMVLQRLHAKSDMLLGMIKQLHIELGELNRAPAGRHAAAPKLPAGDATPSAPADGAAAAPAAAADPWGADLATMQEQFRPLHPAMVGQRAEAAARGTQQAAPAAQKGGRGLGGLVWFFGVYFFFQWLLGRGS